MNLSPREIVAELDTFIIGQQEAKRAVSIALRNRWRRLRVDDDLRSEITPKNILMIGPTGVGKTEIARRLAKIADAPFIKIEATKFTEVGYVGRDVDSIIRDLTTVSMKITKDEARKAVKTQAEDEAEEYILDRLLGASATHSTQEQEEQKQETQEQEEQQHTKQDSKARQLLRKKFREGSLDDKMISIELNAPRVVMEVMGPPGMEEFSDHLQQMFSGNQAHKKHMKRMPIKAAYSVLTEQMSEELLDEEAIRLKALENVEQKGIVFLDEIDKIAKGSANYAEVSRAGVQRDLLPLIEGTSVHTKYGTVRTDHILFIASGAFHLSKPSDLVPELQGRLPIRVEMQSLTPDDFRCILLKTKASLIKQYTALFATEELTVTFSDDAIDTIAQYAWQVNESVENIGARRLHTVMERLLDEISFAADALAKTEQTIEIDKDYVTKHLASLVQDADLSQYIL